MGSQGKSPVRLQRSRQHKLVSPNGLECVYVGRPTRWGNPYIVGKEDLLGDGYITKNKKEAVALFKIWLNDPRNRYWLRDAIRDLRGKNLVCWCKTTEVCHGDVLLELANKQT